MMRYILKRDRSGDWGIWDVRRQQFFSEGLTNSEASETAFKMNEQNAEDVKQILGD